jgi:hypothetical protein
MEIRSVLAACAVVVACLQGAGGQQVPPLVPPPPSDEPLLGQGEWSESPCVHSVYLARIAELEAELAMYRTASTAGQVVCTLGGEHARLDGGANGTYTITTNTYASPADPLSAASLPSFALHLLTLYRFIAYETAERTRRVRRPRLCLICT